VTILNRLLILTCLTWSSVLAASAQADTHKCARCGDETCCRAVCHCVPSTEEKKKLCFDCKCEDFCVPGPSVWCGRKCEAMPLPEDQCGCEQNCCISWNIWKPGCAQVRTRKVLVVHEVKKEVPTYKWEVEYLCDSCRQCCAEAMPLKPSVESDIRPVSAETPIEETAAVAPAPVKKPAQKNWLSRLFSE
jgi:hypothetical protein